MKIEDFFEINLEDPHAQIAALAYAKSVRKENRKLSDELAGWVAKVRNIDCDFFSPYEFLIEQFEEDEQNKWDSLQDCLSEALHNQCPSVINVMDNDGNKVIARVVREYDPGEPDVWYLPNGDPGYPGAPGYDFWRFAGIDENFDK